MYAMHWTSKTMGTQAPVLRRPALDISMQTFKNIGTSFDQRTIQTASNCFLSK